MYMDWTAGAAKGTVEAAVGAGQTFLGLPTWAVLTGAAAAAAVGIGLLWWAL